MNQTLAQAREKLDSQAKRQAYEDLGLEYHARVLIPAQDDAELQSIINRENQFKRDNRTPAPIRKELAHMESIDNQVEQIIYHREITETEVYQLGLLSLLWHHHLERIELGDQNPLATELLNLFKKLK